MTSDYAQNEKSENTEKRARVLDPIHRISEIAFGALMALTFTGTLAVATANQEEVQSMLYAALGCNLAWGLADAVIFLISTVTERHRGDTLLRRLQATNNAQEGQQQIADVLPERLAAVATPDALETLRLSLLKISPTTRPKLELHDFVSAVCVFALVALATFPIVIPFMFIADAALALRVSNWCAVVMLFISGVVLGRHAGGSPILYGISFAVIGALLVNAIIALGG
jgi:VIT1/CCC1 family predicted Fe2+/Mn2+ transporter